MREELPRPREVVGRTPVPKLWKLPVGVGRVGLQALERDGMRDPQTPRHDTCRDPETVQPTTPGFRGRIGLAGTGISGSKPGNQTPGYRGRTPRPGPQDRDIVQADTGITRHRDRDTGQADTGKPRLIHRDTETETPALSRTWDTGSGTPGRLADGVRSLIRASRQTETMRAKPERGDSGRPRHWDRCHGQYRDRRDGQTGQTDGQAGWDKRGWMAAIYRNWRCNAVIAETLQQVGKSVKWSIYVVYLWRLANLSCNRESDLGVRIP